jgi:threonine dehydratase
MRLVSIDDVRRAARAIADVAVRTPLVACPWAENPGRLQLKPENLQATGSFKIRGAYNAVGALSPDQRRTGV